MKHDLYVIEKRDKDGKLDFSKPQPEDFFGMVAITGITENQMSDVIFRHNKDAVLDGRHLLRWPEYLCPGFYARRKNW